ncbi:MAG: hypothetical protein JWN59_1293 [Sphingomonas bacterium]|nr:hypothetical protein [Sphingomonas bacterium]
MNRQSLVIAATIAAMVAGGAQAHHSFAVFFDANKVVRISGVVTDFRFVNPHGEIGLNVPGKGGKAEQWRVETNAPVILRRRGWTGDSLKPGNMVTIEGWPSRDGKRYSRLLKATRADGTVIGIPFDQAAQQ